MKYHSVYYSRRSHCHSRFPDFGPIFISIHDKKYLPIRIVFQKVLSTTPIGLQVLRVEFQSGKNISQSG